MAVSSHTRPSWGGTDRRASRSSRFRSAWREYSVCAAVHSPAALITESRRSDGVPLARPRRRTTCPSATRRPTVRGLQPMILLASTHDTHSCRRSASARTSSARTQRRAPVDTPARLPRRGDSPSPDPGPGRPPPRSASSSPQDPGGASTTRVSVRLVASSRLLGLVARRERARAPATTPRIRARRGSLERRTRTPMRASLESTLTGVPVDRRWRATDEGRRLVPRHPLSVSGDHEPDVKHTPGNGLASTRTGAYETG